MVRALSVPGALEVTPVQHGDDRGVFLEWFREDAFVEATGHALHLAQANCSVSQAGILRGIHFAELPPSQAKYVTCVHGAVLDVVVDIRVGSPTFGQWDSVLLDDVDRRAVYLSEGLGHAFMALEDDTVVNYLCSAPYAPGREHGIHPLDPEIGIAWPDDRPRRQPPRAAALPEGRGRPHAGRDPRHRPAGHLRRGPGLHRQALTVGARACAPGSTPACARPCSAAARVAGRRGARQEASSATRARVRSASGAARAGPERHGPPHDSGVGRHRPGCPHQGTRGVAA